MQSNTDNVHSRYQTPTIYVLMHNVSIVFAGVRCIHTVEVTDLILPTDTLKFLRYAHDSMMSRRADWVKASLALSAEHITIERPCT